MLIPYPIVAEACGLLEFHGNMGLRRPSTTGSDKVNTTHKVAKLITWYQKCIAPKASPSGHVIASIYMLDLDLSKPQARLLTYKTAQRSGLAQLQAHVLIP